MTAAVADFGIERLVHIDRRIDEHEGEALRDRWEFGRELLAKRDGKGRLPNGYMTDLAERTGKSRRELSYRVQFAERFPSEEELCNALHSYGSWFEVTQRALKRPDATDTDSPPPAAPAEGLVSTIVADPPWQYGNLATRGSTRKHYKTMSIEELCGLDIARNKAADAAHLYLWATAGHLRQAFDVMEAWGFEYKTYLVWIKPQMGLGNYFRVSSELVLFGTKGGLGTNSKSIKNHFEAKRGKHSAKPEKFHQLVMASSPGPYLEMFARCAKDDSLPGMCRCTRCRLGWEVWGNEA